MTTIRETDEFVVWITGLRDRAARPQIAKRVRRPALGQTGDTKSVGDGVSELSLTFGPGYRVSFTRRGGEIVILLCGGDKGSQARDIARAKALAAVLEEG